MLTELQQIRLEIRKLKEQPHTDNRVLDLIDRLARELDSVLRIATSGRTPS